MTGWRPRYPIWIQGGSAYIMREIRRLSKVKLCVRDHPVKELSAARYHPLPGLVIDSHPHLKRRPIRENGGEYGVAHG
jgi:hypothetical protein